MFPCIAVCYLSLFICCSIYLLSLCIVCLTLHVCFSVAVYFSFPSASSLFLFQTVPLEAFMHMENQ